MEKHNKVFHNSLLAGQYLIITGGGTGIGLETAFQAAEIGAKGIAICGRRVEKLQAAKELIEKASPGVRVIYESCASEFVSIDALHCADPKGDIRDAASVDKFVLAVKAQFGSVDVLVNNAGGQFPINAESLSSKGFDAVIKNNLVGTWNMIRAVATTLFIPQRRGAIVNVIAQIRNGFPGMVHTGAARAGVDNLTKTLAIEWSKFGIRVNAVAPGVILTSGTDQYPPQLLISSKAATPLQRCGTAEEVSALIIYLASGASSFVTGQTYYIDGGQSLTGSFMSSEWTTSPKKSANAKL